MTRRATRDDVKRLGTADASNRVACSARERTRTIHAAMRRASVECERFYDIDPCHALRRAGFLRPRLKIYHSTEFGHVVQERVPVFDQTLVERVLQIRAVRLQHPVDFVDFAVQATVHDEVR